MKLWTSPASRRASTSTPAWLGPVYDRLRQVGTDEPAAARTMEVLTGRPSPAREDSYRQRRKEMLLALLDQYSDGVDKAVPAWTREEAG